MLKVARDRKNLYFYARTRAPIAPPGGPNWMVLLLNTDADPSTGWEGYDYIVNHTIRGGSRGVLERHLSGWTWKPVAEVRFVVRGNELHLAIPRRALGLEAKQGPLGLEFKWVDNVPDSGDILDYIDQGDAAPNGRYAYRFTE